MNYYQHTNISYVVKFVNSQGETEETLPFADYDSARIFSMISLKKAWVEEVTEHYIPEALLN